MSEHELKFVAPVIAAWQRYGPKKQHAFIWMLLLFFGLFAIWASLTRLDEITQCEGRVVASGRVQIIDNLEGGILGEMLVKEGDIVEQGQVLARIHNPNAAAELAEFESRYYSRLAAAARLTAEVNNQLLVMPEEVVRHKPDSAADEMKLYEMRQQLQSSQEQILAEQMNQKQHELREAEEKYKQLGHIYEIVGKELKVTEPLMKEKLIPMVDYLRQQKEEQDIRGQIRGLESTLPKIEAGLMESQERLLEAREKRRAESMQELRNIQAELDGLKQSLAAKRDRIQRTELRAPVKGTVKVIKVNTVGSVIKSGDTLMEVVPLEDNMVVEALVKPSDIAFIHVGLPAKLKISAYDYSIYGAVTAEVENVSADTFTDQQNNSFYKVKLKTSQNYLAYQGKKLPIISGMMVNVDIVTGKKSVMHYLLKPLTKAQASALRER